MSSNNVEQKRKVTALNTVMAPVDFLNHVKTLAQGAQFYWFLTLVSTVWFTFTCMIKSIFYGTSSSTTISSYKFALNSVLITYLIVLRQTYKNKPVTYIFNHIYQVFHFFFSTKDKQNFNNNTNSSSSNGSSNNKSSNDNAGVNQVQQSSTHKSTSKKKFLRDDNLQYLLFAVSHWLFATPYFGTVNPSILHPFGIYALFHATKYIQVSILPYLPYVSAAAKQKWNSNLNHFYRTFHERSKILASNFEVLLITFYITPLIKLFFRILMGRFWREMYGGLPQLRYDIKIVVLFIVTVTFLRARYALNPFTRTQVTNYDSQIKRIIWNPLIPNQLRQVFLGLRKLIGDFLELVSFV